MFKGWLTRGDRGSVLLDVAVAPMKVEILDVCDGGIVAQKWDTAEQYVIPWSSLLWFKPYVETDDA